MAELSLIDFTQDTDALPRQVDAAFSDIGFLLARNLGVDQTLLAQVYRASHDFFARPQADKLRFEYRSAEENFGYQGLQQENLDPSAPADLKETFTMRNVLNRPLPDDRWPGVEFKTLMHAFYENVFAASRRLQGLLARVLDLPEDFFTPLHTGENTTLRLLYYPACDGVSVTEGQLGAGAHTDYGMLTFLFQDAVGGLQVKGMDNQWIDVRTPDDGIVINCGDLLERWTNGRYPSTLHRVQPQVTGRDRLSIAMFIDPDSDTLVECLPSCISDDRPAKYPPITAGEHVQQMLNASHKDRYVDT